MKQRFSSSRELEEEEGYDDATAAAAARARGFSKLTKFMKSRGSSSSTTTTPYHNSLFRGGRLPEQSSSTITELSSFRRRRTPEELPNQEELPQQQQPQPTSRSSSRNRMYTCKTCGRQFATFQALGGHRASHKMKLVGGPGIVGEDGSYQHFQYKAKLHRCSICDKGYQTGQALGGHMRKHRELLENQRLASAAASSNAHHHHHQNAANNQSNALRWAEMNAAAIFQYSNPAQRYNNAPHPPAAETGAEAGAGEEILREKVPTRKGFNFDLNLDALENEELGLGADEY